MKVVNNFLQYEVGDYIYILENAQDKCFGVGWDSGMDSLGGTVQQIMRVDNKRGRPTVYIYRDKEKSSTWALNYEMIRPATEKEIYPDILVGESEYVVEIIPGKDYFKVGCQTITKEQFLKIKERLQW